MLLLTVVLDRWQPPQATIRDPHGQADLCSLASISGSGPWAGLGSGGARQQPRPHCSPGPQLFRMSCNSSTRVSQFPCQTVWGLKKRSLENGWAQSQCWNTPSNRHHHRHQNKRSSTAGRAPAPRAQPWPRRAAQGRKLRTREPQDGSSVPFTSWPRGWAAREGQSENWMAPANQQRARHGGQKDTMHASDPPGQKA